MRANIAFKCTYSDGGQSNDQIGYCGVCSDEIIEYNLKNGTWCAESLCKKYYDQEMTRSELEDECKNDKYICYESQMLRDWKAMAGVIQKGRNKGKPMKLKQVQINSLCILTTRNPDSTEKQRYIFAVFLVDDSYDGDNWDEGYVAAHSKFKIKLSTEEAHKLLFWNYYANENHPEKPAWGSGLHRYLNDVKAVQILRDIVNVKKGTKDEALANEFLNHFCQVNLVDISEIGMSREDRNE